MNPDNAAPRKEGNGPLDCSAQDRIATGGHWHQNRNAKQGNKEATRGTLPRSGSGKSCRRCGRGGTEHRNQCVDSEQSLPVLPWRRGVKPTRPAGDGRGSEMRRHGDRYRAMQHPIPPGRPPSRPCSPKLGRLPQPCECSRAAVVPCHGHDSHLRLPSRSYDSSGLHLTYPQH